MKPSTEIYSESESESEESGEEEPVKVGHLSEKYRWFLKHMKPVVLLEKISVPTTRVRDFFIQNLLSIMFFVFSILQVAPTKAAKPGKGKPAKQICGKGTVAKVALPKHRILPQPREWTSEQLEEFTDKLPSSVSYRFTHFPNCGSIFILLLVYFAAEKGMVKERSQPPR